MIEVLEAGALTSVQDAFGRPGWRHLGVPVGGAADAWSARLANRLVGNDDSAAVLEITLQGPALRFETRTQVAMTGARFDAILDGRPMSPCRSHFVHAGSTLRIGSGDGARAYLAIGGGLLVEPLLGSSSTELRSGFGGHDGRALAGGDRLKLGPVASIARRWLGAPDIGPIRIVTGPHADRFAPHALATSRWLIGVASDRAGARLDGDPLERMPDAEPEVASMGLPVGAIQVPPDGVPIVMLADRPVTGGYPVPACLIRADVGRVALLRTGDPVAFTMVSQGEARAALRRREEEAAAIADLDPSAGDEVGWAGALE
jgi:biotin-dependent carboxylase-like uncharacterized protein